MISSIEIAPVHHIYPGSSRFHIAAGHIRERNEAAAAIRGHRLGNFASEHAFHNEALQVWIPEARTTFSGFSNYQQRRADALLRQYGLPKELIDGFDEQTPWQGRTANLATWLGHEPSDEEPFGATDEQLEVALVWNAENTERWAQKSELVPAMIDDYLARVSVAAQTGGLDAQWADATPRISRIVIGDILNSKFLGYQGANEHGHYDKRTAELTVWPYATEGGMPLQHIVDHETTHSIGGFSSLWLREGFAEIYTLIAEGGDPNADNNVYGFERGAIHRLMNYAPNPITYRETSACYIGHDHAANERQLQELFKEAFNGYDVLGAVNAAYNEMSGGDPVNLLDPQVRMDAAVCAELTASIVVDCIKLVEGRSVASMGTIIKSLEQVAVEDEGYSIAQIAYKHVAALLRNTAIVIPSEIV